MSGLRAPLRNKAGGIGERGEPFEAYALYQLDLRKICESFFEAVEKLLSDLGVHAPINERLDDLLLHRNFTTQFRYPHYGPRNEGDG